MSMSQALKEPDQGGAVCGIHHGDGIAMRLCFATMPQDRLQQRPCASIMKEIAMAGHLLRQSNAPEGWRPPFIASCAGFGPSVGQPRPHIVQQHVCVGPNQLEALLWLIDQPVGHKRGRVARCTARIIEYLLAAQNRRGARLAARGAAAAVILTPRTLRGHVQ